MIHCTPSPPSEPSAVPIGIREGVRLRGAPLPRGARLRSPFLLAGPLLLAALLLLPAATQLEAQDPSRQAILDAARGEFDDARAVTLLLQAADPGAGAPDSLWAVSVHELAFALIRSGDATSAELWLRWAARHADRWPLDRSWFPPAVVEVWERAAARVGAGQEVPTPVETGWTWEDPRGGGALGRLAVVDAGGLSGLTATVEGPAGRETVGPGTSREFAPGTYSVTLSADGHEPSTLEREVLPGVATRLVVELVPTLSEAARTGALGSLVRIEWPGGGDACTNGVLVGEGRGVLTTSSGLGARSGLRVVTASGRVLSGVSVVQVDELRDLALLRLDEAERVSGGGTPVAAGFGWVLHRQGCGEVATRWTRLQGSGAPLTWGLVPGLPAEARGAPLVHPASGVVGVVTGERIALSLQATDAFVRGGLGTVVAAGAQVPSVRSGGPPWKWIGAGVALAAVGIGAAMGGGGGNGGGGGGGGGPPPPGTIVISFPGG